MQSKVSSIAERAALLRAAVNRIFGYNFFISYAWADGRPYAEEIERALTSRPLGYRCFLDRKEMGGGEAWRASVRRALRRSSVAVLVGTPAALASDSVLEEVRTFAGRGSPIVPIDFLGTVGGLATGHRMFQYLEERIQIDEPDVSALDSGAPSPRVVEFLTSSFGFVRVARLRTLTLTVVAALLLALSGSLAWYFSAERDARAHRAPARHGLTERKPVAGRAWTGGRRAR